MDARELLKIKHSPLSRSVRRQTLNENLTNNGINIDTSAYDSDAKAVALSRSVSDLALRLILAVL